MRQLLKVQVGSYTYGTNIENSDVDYNEVHQCSNNEIFGFDYKDEIQFNKDHKSYEIKKFLWLLYKANPNILELLFTDDKFIVYKDPILNELFENKQKFITKQCLLSFGNYAITQLQKATALDKKVNWEKSRVDKKDILDFCFVNIGEGKSKPVKEFLGNKNYKQSDIGLVSVPNMKNCYYMFLPENWETTFKSNFKGIVKNEENSNTLCLSSIPKNSIDIGLLYWNLENYQIYCKEYKEYQHWLENRNTNRYSWDTTQQTYDLKNIMHCRRLLNVALEIANTGTFTVFRPENSYLKDIRLGNVDIKELINNLQKDTEIILNSFNNSKLPENVDLKWLESYLIEIRNK